MVPNGGRDEKSPRRARIVAVRGKSSSTKVCLVSRAPWTLSIVSVCFYKKAPNSAGESGKRESAKSSALTKLRDTPA